MSDEKNEDTTTYEVVVNHEAQYSIWSRRRERPLGWRGTGVTGSKQECLDHIAQLWTDMRPLSLRQATQQKSPPAAGDA